MSMTVRPAGLSVGHQLPWWRVAQPWSPGSGGGEGEPADQAPDGGTRIIDGHNLEAMPNKPVTMSQNGMVKQAISTSQTPAQTSEMHSWQLWYWISML